MSKTGEDNHAPASLDLGNLAATIALASEALAAAAEALAEAARAILDASGTFDASPSKEFNDPKRRTDVFEESGPRNKPLPDKSLLAQVDSHALLDQQSKSQGTLTPATPAQLDLSDSRSEVGMVPLRPPQVILPSARFPPHETKDPQPKEIEEIQTEQNNKLDALPPSPVLSTSQSGSGVSPAWSFEVLVTGDSQAPQFSNFQMAMQSHPIILPGRNFINLGQVSDALAFIAFLALQANRTICMIPVQFMDSYSKQIKSLTHANVYRAYTPEQVSRVVGSRLDFFAPTSYNIVLTPSSEFIANAESFKRAAPDCIVHWGEPSDARQYIDRVLAPLPHSAKTCVMVIKQPTFNGKSYGIVPYPHAVLNACFHASSPLQQLRQISSRLPVPPLTEPRVTIPRPNPLPLKPSGTPAPTDPQNRKHNIDSLPVGHYYIVLDTANDIDIIPMVTYFATNHEKVICYVPSDFLAGYQRLIHSISGVNVIAPLPSAIGKQIKGMTNRLKIGSGGVLLRPSGTGWNSFLSKSLANAVVHCGVPADLNAYLNECITKVEHSYLVLSRSQHYDIRSLLDWDQRIQRHPKILSPPSPGNFLYDLRQKAVPFLK